MENIRSAVSGILAHKLRALLTMLGIIIGIASIMAIVSTIQGTNLKIKNSLIGRNNQTVNVILQSAEGMNFEPGMGWNSPEPLPRPLTAGDLLELTSDPAILGAARYRFVPYAMNTYWKDQDLGSAMYAVDENFFGLSGLRLSSGSAFAPAHFTHASKVLLIDEQLVQRLGMDKPIGSVIDIQGNPYTIIGTVSASEEELVAEDYNDYMLKRGSQIPAVYMPLPAWEVQNAFDEPHAVLVRAASTDLMPKAGKAAADALNRILQRDEKQLHYASTDMLQQAKELQQLANATNQQLIWIASISLLVGGIGVMNIMLVSVSERTKEIGLKKALGARKRTILIQFLVEAGVLTCIGGVIGVLLGIALAFVISMVTSAPAAINLPVSALSVLFSIFIGLFFGFLPARKAARLDPIQALRYE